MTEYRAISLHQPWASLVALGIKKYETRSWDTKYRGKLLICSTQKYSVTVGLMKDAGLIWGEYPALYDDGITDATESQKKLADRMGWTYVVGEYATSARGKSLKHAKPSKYFCKGSVLCVVDLANTYKMGSYPRLTAYYNERQSGVATLQPGDEIIIETIPDLEQLCGDWQIGRYAWELANLMPLPEPIPIKGKQGLWIPDNSIIQEVERQLFIG